jgi:hypothetical protein
MELNKIFKSSLTYKGYRDLVDQLIANGKTTGNNQTDMLIEFTKLNIQRMNRLDKTIQLPEAAKNALGKITKSFQWLIIGDAWCGDCAQIIPVINKIAESAQGKIDFRIISRDTIPELIEAYLTNGTKSIPKLLFIDNKTDTVIDSWGSRPAPAHEIMLNWKKNKGAITHEDFEKEIHLWYARDKGLTIINELVSLVEKH